MEKGKGKEKADAGSSKVDEPVVQVMDSMATVAGQTATIMIVITEGSRESEPSIEN